MLLSPQEAERFFRLHRTLMFFVNERLDIIAGVESPEAFAVLPAEERRKVRDALVERLDLIDAFVEANPTGFSDDELLIVRSWRNQLFGRFYIFRDLVKYTVFLRDKDGPVAFGVTALSQPFESLVGPYLPVMVETVLLPFQNKLVYDGILISYNISFGGGIRCMLNDTYRRAKDLHGIVTTLPVGAPPPARGPREKRPQPKVKKVATDAAAGVLKQIVAMTDAFCRDRLTDEYAALCRKLAEKLARKRPSPLLSGKNETWACGIVRTIGWVNFLDDRANSPHMKLTEIDKAFGVGESTGQGKSAAIRKMLKIGRFDPDWTLPSRLEDNPLAWMVEVDGLVLDARMLRRELQEEAHRMGLIPYVPERPQRLQEENEDDGSD